MTQNQDPNPFARRRREPGSPHWLRKVVVWSLGTLVVLAVCGFIAGLIGVTIAYPNLPDVSELANYQPKQPLRVYTADGKLMEEFGTERRRVVPIARIPDSLKKAVLAAEDARFYEHGGVDYLGVLRAVIANLGNRRSQGASTITMQVARNVYLSSEKTYSRKLYEALLTSKLERTLSKDQILEIYLNQIYLGHRAYGFAAASRTYFGKSLEKISLAEAAMLAGIPKSPSRGNPIANFQRARERQFYVLDRMRENGFITRAEEDDARNETLVIQSTSESEQEAEFRYAPYAAEMARQAVYAQYGESAYTRGLSVYTTIDPARQMAAYQALQQGIFGYERKQAYRGPEKFIKLPPDAEQRQALILDTLADLPPVGEMVATVVLEASSNQLVVMNREGETLTLTGQALIGALSGLSDRAAPAQRIRPGAVVRIMRNHEGKWETIQLPNVEGALVALDPRSGAIEALVGGFDFERNEFNHASQAWRQPGSSFKPFIYSAALEKGFSPATIINDTPIRFGREVTGDKPWEPKNYEGGFQGPMTMRTALARSRNIVSIRILDKITPRFGQEWVTHFGFDASKHPPYLTMALGAGSVTPLQMAAGFGVFANGGYQVSPRLITRIVDHRGDVIYKAPQVRLGEARRAIPARNAFITSSMLQEVTRRGTASLAQRSLGREDLYGKTGTTNNAIDAWFVGFQPTLVAAVWMGYDTPRNLGSRETGGGLSLPIWIDFMRTALKGVPAATMKVPEGVVRKDGDWVYTEYAHDRGISHLDGAGLDIGDDELEGRGFDTRGLRTPAEERDRILDMFRD